MANNYFRFQNFEILQDRCAHKVGTDGVLLGCWVNGENARNILDIGSGSGLISLILAQRFPHARITAIEIDPHSYEQGSENVLRSPYSDRVKTIQGNFLNHRFEEKFDLIVSNPPFFKDYYLSGNPARDTARHQINLPHQKLVLKSIDLLHNNGKVALVLPTEDSISLLNESQQHQIYLQRRTLLRNKPHAFFKRALMELGKTRNPIVEDHISLRNNEGEYSEEYRQLTMGFYLQK